MEQNIALANYRRKKLSKTGDRSKNGNPIGTGAIRGQLKKLIEENNLPPVVFHSLRHSSVTYKLKLNGGDIKAVQGDSGHSQVDMVTDVYSHIINENQKRNAKLLEKVLTNPEMKALLASLAKAMN